MNSSLALEMRAHLFGVRHGRNQKAHKRVDDVCRFQRNFDRIATGEVDFARFVVAVSAAVANVLDHVEDCFDLGAKLKCLDLLPQPSISPVAIQVLHLRNRIAQPLQTNAKKGACRARRKMRDALGLNKYSTNRFRHVLAWIYAHRSRVEQFAVLFDDQFFTGRAAKDSQFLNDSVELVERLKFRVVAQKHGTTKPSFRNDGAYGHVAHRLAMRALESSFIHHLRRFA